jgi:hypothetical protein
MPSLPRIGALLVAACASAAVLVAPAPARAAVPGSTSTGDVVLYDHCQQHSISYAVQIPQGTTFWYLRVTVHDPDGHTSEGNVFTAPTSATTGTFDFQFCGGERAGTWTVKATGYTQVLPLVRTPFALADTAFQVRPMATRTSLASRSLGHRRYRLAARVSQQAEHGFERADGIAVRLERRQHGAWQRVRGLALTTVHGKAVATLTRAGTYRGVVRAKDNHGASTSKPVRLG